MFLKKLFSKKTLERLVTFFAGAICGGSVDWNEAAKIVIDSVK